MPHSINQGDARFAYFNKIWGIPAIKVICHWIIETMVEAIIR